jgi:hypothetical protein
VARLERMSQHLLEGTVGNREIFSQNNLPAVKCFILGLLDTRRGFYPQDGEIR